jgi:inosine-uridine nucleoside N-ribohydrolase
LLPVASWAKEPLILSTDVGNEIDDQWAIVYMMTNPAFDVQGIVSAHAPSFPYPSAHATYEVLVDEIEHRLKMANHPPLFEGSSLALADTRTPRPNSGVDFIVKTSRNYSRANRLTVLTIGAATDLASAILEDPSIVDRIRVVAMGFRNLQEAGKEYNVQNDPRAWQVILDSKAPVTIGCGDVCKKYLSLNFEQARALISSHGAIGAWLWQEYQAWCLQHVEPIGKNDSSKSWVIWDIIVLAHEEKMTTEERIPRPGLADDLLFTPAKTNGTIVWIATVDSQALWTDFLKRLDAYQKD